MRAAIATHIDAEDPLALLDRRDYWPEQAVPAGYTTITVAATTVNMHDLWWMRGVGIRPEQFPMVLGCDIAGWDPAGNEVLVTGAFGDPDAGGGDETFDPNRALISERYPGSFAERTVVPARNVLPKPPWLSFHETACLNVAWSTAYRPLLSQADDVFGKVVLDVVTNHSPGGQQ